MIKTKQFFSFKTFIWNISNVFPDLPKVLCMKQEKLLILFFIAKLRTCLNYIKKMYMCVCNRFKQYWTNCFLNLTNFTYIIYHYITCFLTKEL